MEQSSIVIESYFLPGYYLSIPKGWRGRSYWSQGV